MKSGWVLEKNLNETFLSCIDECNIYVHLYDINLMLFYTFIAPLEEYSSSWYKVLSSVIIRTSPDPLCQK